MTSILITNIGELCTNDNSVPGELGIRHDAALLVENGKVSWHGSATYAPAADQVVDVGGAAVLPGFVDSHAHLVFAGDRSAEFAARMAGQSYSAGGINSTVLATRAAKSEQLLSNAQQLRSELIASGVTTFECKTGYGLTYQDELRSLEIAAKVTDQVTLLAAHVVPAEFKDNPSAYVELIIEQLLPAAVGKAKWVDVFCETGAFTVEQTEQILTAAKALGFGLKLHANQLGFSDAVQLGVKLDCASVDHCTYLSDPDIQALAGGNTVATLLPITEFSTKSPYPSARRLLDAGVQVAIATNCNPGSGFSTSMPLAIALAVREMGMTPAEAVVAATLGGASALRASEIGHLQPGAKADFVVLTAPSHVFLAYRPGVNLISEVWQSGRQVFRGKAS